VSRACTYHKLRKLQISVFNIQCVYLDIVVAITGGAYCEQLTYEVYCCIVVTTIKLCKRKGKGHPTTGHEGPEGK
jgi:hypothetical protein